MTSRVDLYMLEKKVGKEAADKLRSAFKFEIRHAVDVTKDGEAKDATVNAKYDSRTQRLDRITFSAPNYLYKLNFGFEGKKSNGINMRLKAINVLQKALNRSGVLDDLADKIANIRGEEVITAINFLNHNNGR